MDGFKQLYSKPIKNMLYGQYLSIIDHVNIQFISNIYYC